LREFRPAVADTCVSEAAISFRLDRNLCAAIGHRLLDSDSEIAQWRPSSFPMVGVGASAGGLEGFQRFCRAYPRRLVDQRPFTKKLMRTWHRQHSLLSCS